MGPYTVYLLVLESKKAFEHVSPLRAQVELTFLSVVFIPWSCYPWMVQKS